METRVRHSSAVLFPVCMLVASAVIIVDNGVYGYYPEPAEDIALAQLHEAESCIRNLVGKCAPGERELYMSDPTLAEVKIKQEPCARALASSDWMKQLRKDDVTLGFDSGCKNCASNRAQDIFSNLAQCLGRTNINCCSCLFHAKAYPDVYYDPLANLPPSVPAGDILAAVNGALGSANSGKGQSTGQLNRRQVQMDGFLDKVGGGPPLGSSQQNSAADQMIAEVVKNSIQSVLANSINVNKPDGEPQEVVVTTGAPTMEQGNSNIDLNTLLESLTGNSGKDEAKPYPLHPQNQPQARLEKNADPAGGAEQPALANIGNIMEHILGLPSAMSDHHTTHVTQVVTGQPEAATGFDLSNFLGLLNDQDPTAGSAPQDSNHHEKAASLQQESQHATTVSLESDFMGTQKDFDFLFTRSPGTIPSEPSTAVSLSEAVRDLNMQELQSLIKEDPTKMAISEDPLQMLFDTKVALGSREFTDPSLSSLEPAPIRIQSAMKTNSADLTMNPEFGSLLQSIASAVPIPVSLTTLETTEATTIATTASTNAETTTTTSPPTTSTVDNSKTEPVTTDSTSTAASPTTSTKVTESPGPESAAKEALNTLKKLGNDPNNNIPKDEIQRLVDQLESKSFPPNKQLTRADVAAGNTLSAPTAPSMRSPPVRPINGSLTTIDQQQATTTITRPIPSSSSQSRTKASYPAPPRVRTTTLQETAYSTSVESEEEEQIVTIIDYVTEPAEETHTLPRRPPKGKTVKAGPYIKRSSEEQEVEDIAKEAADERFATKKPVRVDALNTVLDEITKTLPPTATGEAGEVLNEVLKIPFDKSLAANVGKSPFSPLKWRVGKDKKSKPIPSNIKPRDPVQRSNRVQISKPRRVGNQAAKLLGLPSAASSHQPVPRNNVAAQVEHENKQQQQPEGPPEPLQERWSSNRGRPQNDKPKHGDGNAEPVDEKVYPDEEEIADNRQPVFRPNPKPLVRQQSSGRDKDPPPDEVGQLEDRAADGQSQQDDTPDVPPKEAPPGENSDVLAQYDAIIEEAVGQQPKDKTNAMGNSRRKPAGSNGGNWRDDQKNPPQLAQPDYNPGSDSYSASPDYAPGYENVELDYDGEGGPGAGILPEPEQSEVRNEAFKRKRRVTRAALRKLRRIRRDTVATPAADVQVTSIGVTQSNDPEQRLLSIAGLDRIPSRNSSAVRDITSQYTQQEVNSTTIQNSSTTSFPMLTMMVGNHSKSTVAPILNESTASATIMRPTKAMDTINGSSTGSTPFIEVWPSTTNSTEAENRGSTISCASAAEAKTSSFEASSRNPSSREKSVEVTTDPIAVPSSSLFTILSTGALPAQTGRP